MCFVTAINKIYLSKLLELTNKTFPPLPSFPFARFTSADSSQRHRSVKIGSPRAATRGITIHSPEGATTSTSGNPASANAVSGSISPEGSLSENKATVGANGGGHDESIPETLNLPAVLWDKPPGSKTRVPPPVPPRSPKRPLDPSGAFATASSLEDGFILRGSIHGTSSSSCLLFSLRKKHYQFASLFCSLAF